MTYGKDIGKKFYEDGTVRHYPGNTVVADIIPGCSAYDVMLQLRQMLTDGGLAQYFVLLPADSYHMTVIRGLNDQVRTDDYWPAGLSKTAPMTQVDDYISAAIEKAGLPGPVRMRLDRVNVSASCCTVRLVPADEAQAQLLQQFRDRAADAIGLRLPGHDNYRFHISLGYVRVVPEGTDAQKLEDLKAKMDAFIAGQPEFTTTAPYMAYYDDMLAFSPERIPRA